MKIIPVIDLKNGKVVHARLGNRSDYQPIQSTLCRSPVCDDVLTGFLNLYPFDTFYIADLDAISGLGHHDALIAELLARYPQSLFWIDQGNPNRITHAEFPDNYLPVLGSESCLTETVRQFKNDKRRFALSLDHSASGALGPEKLFASPEIWPDDVIIMTLAKVGSQQGPDFDKLAHYRKLCPDKNFVAAGGVRNAADLAALTQLGIKQAMIASSLHSGAIQRADIEKQRQKNTPASRGIVNKASKQ